MVIAAFALIAAGCAADPDTAQREPVAPSVATQTPVLAPTITVPRAAPLSPNSPPSPNSPLTPTSPQATSAPAPSPSTAATSSSKPKRRLIGDWGPLTLALPGQGVSADITEATVENAVLEPPRNVAQVGIWTDGAHLDSATGTTLLVGHVDYIGQGDGALHNLIGMKPGDVIVTTDAKGEPTEWSVTEVTTRPKESGVDPAVFVGTEGPRMLALVTCGGSIEQTDRGGSYTDNVYVKAKLVD